MRVRTIAIDPRPKGDGKFIAGADHDDWNDWLASLAASALPIDQNDEAVAIKATTALYHGMIDMKPADPVEGIIISQLMVANQASLAMYQRAWAQAPEYFEARTKYLALADKAARTVVLLTERLDHHRNRGQQKIVVQPRCQNQGNYRTLALHQIAALTPVFARKSERSSQFALAMRFRPGGF
jgi:hypothetical protein